MTEQVKIEFQGRSPLIIHNVELANPMGVAAKAIKEITDKRKKTDADREAIDKLAFVGGLYFAPGIEGPVIPARSLRKTLIEGARLSKQGKDVERALSFSEMFYPIQYEGPRDAESLWAAEVFTDQQIVRVGTQRVVRTRPKFTEWSVTAEGWLEEDLLNLSALQFIADVAGRSIGLGDNRTNGYGRFTVEVIS